MSADSSFARANAAGQTWFNKPKTFSGVLT